MDQERTSAPTPGQSAAPGQKVLWGVCLLAFVVIGGVGMLTFWSATLPPQTAGHDLQPFGPVADFTLIERSGHPVTKADLLGKVWIVDFIFTQCVEECPLASRRMASLQTLFADGADVRLVSITVDPEHDTPAVLTQYAQGLGADAQRWLFLTGKKETIYKLARDNFHLGVVDPNDATQSSRGSIPSVARPIQSVWRWLTPALAWAHHDTTSSTTPRQAITHSVRFVLVDRQGQIRAYYDSTDQAALQRLQRDVKVLLQERP